MWDLGVMDDIMNREVAEEGMIDIAILGLIGLNPAAAGGIGLRVHVNEKGSFLGGCETGRQVDGSRRLANAALLVGYGNDCPLLRG